MKISVIIPTYKPQAYLWECLDSLANQTFAKSDFEVLLILNGCKDPYEKLIRAYLNRHSDLQVIFIQTDQAGVSNARNIALNMANGEYVAFIDDDDYVSSRYLEELYAKASPNTISLSYAFAFKEGKPEKQLDYYISDAYDSCIKKKGKHRLLSSARKFFSGPCMKLIPRTFIQNRRFDVRFRNGEDSLFMFLISDKIENIAFTSKEAVYFRRYRENSAVVAKRSLSSVINNSLLLITCYTQIYMSSPLKYSFLFYFTRLLGAIHLIVKAF
ncbi:glycosyltransferase family 2 protein [Parabacteroides sp. AGMB00274]|uniref:Glycosyltransferase family 2 protein n=1 Tax=Parabacteroides faecalis TaxID=2924040 RepID=A0ABT0C297_9BACT|nr:glycosyltransferase family 2 protein [Parabacteroides faecalis]MCJ2381158.1 glycosyltransferase family 2 protein [Parabacteroides faecalis]